MYHRAKQAREFLKSSNPYSRLTLPELEELEARFTGKMKVCDLSEIEEVAANLSAVRRTIDSMNCVFEYDQYHRENDTRMLYEETFLAPNKEPERSPWMRWWK